MKHPTLLKIAVALLIGVGGAKPLATQAQPAMDFPQAEWDKAGTILMHTPGMELFDGVVHPSAALFENYFSADSAAAEHRGYIDMLRRRGITVVTVESLLASAPIDSLRALAGEFLAYDTRNLEQREIDSTEAYRQMILSQMTRQDLVRCIMLRPTVRLAHTDNNTGFEAEYIQQPLMNLYFTRDQSITTPRGHIISRMNSSQREAETRVIDFCYKVIGASPILRIEGEGRLEGGDYIPAGTVALIGCGMRTNDEGIAQIMKADAFGHDTVVVVRDHKFWQMQMHLDTYFNIIDRDLCTMVSSRLQAKAGEPEYVSCDIWARAKGEKDYRLFQQDLAFVDYLTTRGFKIIPIDHADEMHYANNYLTIAPRHIMAVGGQSEALQRRFSEAGVKVEWIPLESLIDGYGAAHCMTQVLCRQKPAKP